MKYLKFYSLLFNIHSEDAYINYSDSIKKQPPWKITHIKHYTQVIKHVITILLKFQYF